MHRVMIILLCHSLSGCKGITAGIDQADIKSQLQVGMTREQVIAIVGQPQTRETYGKAEFLIYQTSAVSAVVVSNPPLDNSAFTPIALLDGKVTGWGRNYYEAVTKAYTTAPQR